MSGGAGHAITQMVQTETLSNGLRIIHRPFPTDISYCGVAVNTGTRDEFPDEYGMAHFVEHMLFKGTEKRKAHHIFNRMESVGGEVNAYTSKEETFLYAVFPGEYFSRAVELLGDILFHSQFPEREIEKEREVIIDEILSYDDSPSELIYDDFENLIFAGHDLGHYILGDQASLERFDTGRVKRFVARQYRPPEMVFFSFGKTPFPTVVRLAEKYLSGHVSSTAGLVASKLRTAPGFVAPVNELVRKETSQSHVILGWRTFSMRHPDRYVLYMINHILGGGNQSSRLNVSLRERNGLVYNVESNLTLYSDTGLFTIYFACDPKLREKCLRLVNKEVAAIKEKEVSAYQLSRAKRQLKGQMAISDQNYENSVLAMGKSFLHFDRYLPISAVLEQIDSVSPADILRVSKDIFIPEAFQLSYL